jgi:hypothetical protein
VFAACMTTGSTLRAFFRRISLLVAYGRSFRHSEIFARKCDFTPPYAWLDPLKGLNAK